jgi:hypothetical protein
LHHWNIYECDDDFEAVYLKNNKEPEPSYCEPLHSSQNLTEKWPEISKYCSKISFVWAVGGDTVIIIIKNLQFWNFGKFLCKFVSLKLVEVPAL